MPSGAGAIPDATRSAALGIQKAQRSLAVNAAQVVSMGTASSEQADRLSISGEGRARAAGVPESGEVDSADNADLTELLVEQRLTTHYLAANVRVLQVADEMSEELLRTTRT